MPAAERDQPHVGLRFVRVREDRRAILLEQLDGRWSVANQPVDASRSRRREGRGRPAPLDVPEHLTNARRREITPAVFGQDPAGDEVAEAIGVSGGVDIGPETAERTAEHAHAMAGMREAGLRLDRDGAAQGIEAEQRIGAGHQRHAGDCVGRQQLPVHRVAERLVHAHAVLIDGNALREPEQWRRGKTPELDVRLKRIRLCFVRVYAGESGCQLFTGVNTGPREIGRGRRLNIPGNLVAFDADTRDRRRPHDLDRFLELRRRRLLALLPGRRLRDCSAATENGECQEERGDPSAHSRRIDKGQRVSHGGRIIAD